MKMLRGLRRNHFACIVADVPWKYVVRSKKGLGRSAEKHYDTMTLEEIAAMPVARYAAKDCHLFFWVTGPFFAKGAHAPIMRAWGFEPVATAFVWVKPTKGVYENGNFFFDDRMFKMNMGHTTRQNAEYVVLGRRGKPKRISKKVRQVIGEPQREHSRKPEQFFQRVEQYCEGPRLELFSRARRKGWTTRGNQVDLFEKQK